MIELKKKFKVTLAGEPYTLMSDEPEYQVLKAVSLLNALLQEQAFNAMAVPDQKKGALLAALTLANKVVFLESVLEGTETKSKKLLDQIEHALLKN